MQVNGDQLKANYPFNIVNCYINNYYICHFTNKKSHSSEFHVSQSLLGIDAMTKRTFSHTALCPGRKWRRTSRQVATLSMENMTAIYMEPKSTPSMKSFALDGLAYWTSTHR